MSVLYASLASFGFGIFFQLRGKKLLAAAIGGGIGWLFYTLFAPQGPMVQNFAASLMITIYAEMLARTQRAPVLVYLTPALIPLVPGGAIYQAMLLALNGDTDAFLSTGLLAMSITGSIALGVVAASSVMRLLFFAQPTATPRIGGAAYGVKEENTADFAHIRKEMEFKTL